MAHISIVIPIYQTKEEYLKQCINSLIHQTKKDIEIILIDDGSTNGASVICDEYVKKDSRIKVIHQENQGVSAARNAGIKLASSEWIIFVDPDDWIEQNLCERIYEVLKDKSDIDILMWGFAINGKGYEKKELYDYEHRLDFKGNEKEQLLLNILDSRKCLNIEWMKFKMSGSVCNKCYRKNIAIEKNIRFFCDLRRMEDLVFNLYMIEESQKISYIDEALYHYRKNSISACNRYNVEIEDLNFKLLNRVLEYIEKYDKDDKFFAVYMIRACKIHKYVFALKYFHNENKIRYSKNRKDWLNFVNSDIFVEIMDYFKNPCKIKLDKKTRLINFLCRKKHFFLLQTLYKVKRFMKLKRYY